MKLFCRLKKPPSVKNLPAMRKTWVQSWVRKIPGEGKGYCSSILARRIPRTVQSMGPQRVRHD